MTQNKIQSLKFQEAKLVLDNMIDFEKNRDKAHDYYENPLLGLGPNQNNLLAPGTRKLTRLTYNYQQLVILYRNNYIVQRAIDTRANDLYREGIVHQSEISPKDIHQINRKLKRIKPKLVNGQKWGSLFGGAMSLILTTFADEMVLVKERDAFGNEVSVLKHRMELPLNESDITKDSFIGLEVRDRFYGGFISSAELDADMESTNYGLPLYYNFKIDEKRTLKIHNSWIIRHTGKKMPRVEELANQYWGASILEVSNPEIDRFDAFRESIANTVLRQSQRYIKIENLKDYLNTPEQEQEIKKRLDMLKLASNGGIVAIDQDDDMGIESTSFTGVPELFNENKLLVVASLDSTVQRVFGALGGNTGTTIEDERIYYTSIANEQEEKLRPIFDKLLPILFRSELGIDMPDDYDYDFKYLGDSKDTTTYRSMLKEKLDVIKEQFMFGIIPKSVALQEIKQIGEEYGIGTNITEEYINEIKELEEEMDKYATLGEEEENPRINQYSNNPNNEEYTQNTNQDKDKKLKDGKN